MTQTAAAPSNVTPLKPPAPTATVVPLPAPTTKKPFLSPRAKTRVMEWGATVIPPLPAPAATLEEAQGVILPAAEPAPVQAAPSLAPSTPMAGVQLQYRSAPPPAYPVPALRNHEQGTVLLRVEVDTSGKPVNVSIERSSGSRSLDQAARQQVSRQWRPVPAERAWVAVPAIRMASVPFPLPVLWAPRPALLPGRHSATHLYRQ